MSPLDNLHERLLLLVGWIKHADTKATAELSGAAALSGVAAAQLGGAGTPAVVLLIASLAGSLFAGYHAGSALVPRTKPSEYNQESTLFFGVIAKTTSTDELLQRFHRHSDAEVTHDYVHQIRELSMIARAKFQHNDRAVIGLAFSALILAGGLAMKGVT